MPLLCVLATHVLLAKIFHFKGGKRLYCVAGRTLRRAWFLSSFHKRLKKNGETLPNFSHKQGFVKEVPLHCFCLPAKTPREERSQDFFCRETKQKEAEACVFFLHLGLFRRHKKHQPIRQHSSVPQVLCTYQRASCIKIAKARQNL